VRQAVRINGVNELAVTNLDGLDTLPTIKVCLGYRVGRKRYDVLPADMNELAACQPVYAEFEGWCTPTHGARSWKALPARARAYLKALEDLVGAPIRIISVGPAREQTIVR